MDVSIRLVAVMGQSTPSFWVAILLRLSSTFALLCRSGSQADVALSHRRVPTDAAGARVSRMVSCHDGARVATAWGSPAG